MRSSHIASASFVGLALLLAAASLPADELLMMNGDRLTGTVVDKTGLNIMFESAYAGLVRIPANEIRKIVFSAPRKLLDADQSLVEVVSLERIDDKVVAVTTDQPEPHPIDALKLTTPPAGDKDSLFESAFTGVFNVAFQDESGNNEKSELDVDYDLTYRLPNDRFRSDALAEFEARQGIRSKQDWSTNGQYDHFLSKRLYAGAMLGLKQEKFADLDLRSVVGPVLGYQFFESKEMNLLGEFAVLYVHESYSEQASRSYWGPGWRIKFDRYLLDERLQFYHNEIGYVSAKDIDKFVWISFTGFRLPLLLGFVASTEVEFDYDGDPATEAEKLDTTFRFKLGYQW